eukprot:9761592-Prorocentrum_lima.AAC.1
MTEEILLDCVMASTSGFGLQWPWVGYVDDWKPRDNVTPFFRHDSAAEGRAAGYCRTGPCGSRYLVPGT